MKASDVSDYKIVDGERVALTQEQKEAIAEERTPTVSKRKASMREAARQLRIDNARKPVSYDGKTYDADLQAQQKLTGKLSYAQATGKDSDSTWSVGWKTADNTFVQLSYDDLAAVVRMVNEQVQAAYNREAEILSQIEQATTIQELDAISVESGWP